MQAKLVKYYTIVLWYAIVMMESIELKSSIAFNFKDFFLCVCIKCINVLLEVEVSCINKEKLNDKCNVLHFYIRHTFLILKYIKLGNGAAGRS